MKQQVIKLNNINYYLFSGSDLIDLNKHIRRKTKPVRYSTLTIFNIHQKYDFVALYFTEEHFVLLKDKNIYDELYKLKIMKERKA